MPSVKSIADLYRFFFYSFDCREPKLCKFRLEPIYLAKNSGFTPKELNDIHKLIANNVEKIPSGGLV